MYYLLVSDGESEREAVLPGGTLTVGRLSSNDIVVAAEDVSRQHAQVRVDGASVEVRDLGTANGTLLARAHARGPSEPVAADGWTRLQPGDRVHLGSSAWLEVRETVGWTARTEDAAGRSAPLAGRLSTLTPHPGIELLVGLSDVVRDGALASDASERAARCVAGLLRLVPRAAAAWLLRRTPEGLVGELAAGAAAGAELPPLAEALASESLADADGVRWADGSPHQQALLACAAGDAALVIGFDDGATLPGADVLHVVRALAALAAALAAAPPRTSAAGAAASSPSRRSDRLVALYRGRIPSREFEDLLERSARMATGRGPVLVSGETGVGKELVAAFLHEVSGRRGAFVEASVSALSSTLVESELFGHVRGAFTDASSHRTGLMPLADGGTLFLDEIGEVPLDVQAKLLRALETRTVKPVGSNELVPYDALVIAATNRDLRSEVKAGRFREDLYFRLFQFEIRIPPLRERPGDVAVLARQFLSELAPERSLDVRALDWLVRQPWPGNVRELRSVIERATRLHDASVLRPEHLGAGSDGGPAVVIQGLPLNWREASNAFERAWSQAVITAAEGRVGEAALLAGLHRSNLRAKLKNHGLSGASDGGGDED